jgi:hypothetical protein
MTLQTAAGFLLTAAMIYAVSLLDPGNAGGWRLAFALLALGPVVGIAAMLRLGDLPEARLMASGTASAPRPRSPPDGRPALAARARSGRRRCRHRQ